MPFLGLAGDVFLGPAGEAEGEFGVVGVGGIAVLVLGDAVMGIVPKLFRGCGPLPFAEVRGAVGGCGSFEGVGEGISGGRGPVAGVFDHGIQAGGGTAHEQRRPRTLAFWVSCIGLGKNHAARGELFQIGHFEVVGTAQLVSRDHGHRSAAPALVIHKDHDKVWGWGGLGSARGGSQKAHKKCECGAEESAEKMRGTVHG